MNCKWLIKRGVLSIGIFFIFLNICAEVILPRLISNGMVLQRNVPVKIWGWAKPGEQILVSFMQNEYFSVSDPDGNWSVVIPPLTAGGPYEMLIKGSNSIVLNDILIGEVWICSGQSNMEISLKRIESLYPEEIAQSENPEIRYFQFPKPTNSKHLSPIYHMVTGCILIPKQLRALPQCPISLPKSCIKNTEFPLV